MFYDQLKKLCDLSGTTPTSVTEKLGMSKGTVSNWKKGGSPNGDALVRFSEYFGVSIDYLMQGKSIPSSMSEIFSPIERAFIEQFMCLDLREKLLINATFPFILEYQRNVSAVLNKNINDFNDAHNNLKSVDTTVTDIAVYDLPASAGNGQFLDSSDFTMIDFPIDTIPRSTSFGVRIRGDSMIPTIKDGEIVFVKRQPTLLDGEIGIFVLNGDVFCKRYRRSGEDVFLESDNKDNHQPIHITETDDLRLLGLVVGHSYL